MRSSPFLELPLVHDLSIYSKTYLIIFDRLDCCEIDVVLLDDTGIQRVEVHDEDVLIP